MKTTLFIFLSWAFFVVIQTHNDQSSNPSTRTCQTNEVPASCKPCDQFCNEKPQSCIDVCISGNYCRCTTNHSYVSQNDKRCVPNSSCSKFVKPNCTTTTSMTNSPKKNSD